MLKEERFNLILKAVEGRDAVSYEELLTMVDASGATLRRDVDQLWEAGRIRKVRGGVAPLMAAGRPLASYFFGEQAQRAAAAKEAIARRAVELVSTPDTLILYGGSTVARFAEMLPAVGLTVLTDSLPVANHLAFKTDNRVFLTGGEVLAQQGIVLSPFDDPPAFHVAASTFFIGCHAVGPAGIMEDDPLPLRAARALRRQAARLVVLADSTKFGEARSLVVFPLAEVDVFVTDAGISDSDRRMLEDAGVEVLIAPLDRDIRDEAPAEGAAVPSVPQEATDK